MGKSGIGISRASEGMSRPSLLSSGASAADHNILDAMASRAAVSSASSQPSRLIWLLVPLLAATAWGIVIQLQKPPATVPVAQASTAAPTPIASTVTVAVSPAAAPLLTTTAAVVISEAGTGTNPFNTLDGATTPSATSAAPPRQDPAPFDMQAALNTPSPAAANTAKTPAKPARSVSGQQPAGTHAPQEAVTRTPKPKPQVAKAAPPAETKPATKADTAQRVASLPASAPARKSGASDPDVELLSAIMKHLGDEKNVTAAGGRSPQTIAELVKSCKGKDAIEALLCRRRICEDSWGKAQACPLELAPKATAKAAAAPSGH